MISNAYYMCSKDEIMSFSHWTSRNDINSFSLIGSYMIIYLSLHRLTYCHKTLPCLLWRLGMDLFLGKHVSSPFPE